MTMQRNNGEMRPIYIDTEQLELNKDEVETEEQQFIRIRQQLKSDNTDIRGKAITELYRFDAEKKNRYNTYVMSMSPRSPLSPRSPRSPRSQDGVTSPRHTDNSNNSNNSHQEFIQPQPSAITHQHQHQRSSLELRERVLKTSFTKQHSEEERDAHQEVKQDQPSRVQRRRCRFGKFCSLQ